MNEREVNWHLIWDALSAIEGNEVVTGECVLPNPNDELEAKKVFTTIVRSFVQPWSSVKTAKLRLTLAHAIAERPSVLLDEVLPQMQARLMPDPHDERLFLVWLWTCLFPNESLESVDLSNVQVADQASEVDAL